MWQSIIHYGLHILLPLLAAIFFYKSNWVNAFLLMLAMMVIDIDHILATPVFDAGRCSIGYHVLHSYWAMPVYVVMLFIKPLRVFGLGIILHLVTDYIDCLMMQQDIFGNF